MRERALAAFGLLADAEGSVHGHPPDEVHFHEVGSCDSIADIVGVAAALADLGVERLVTEPGGSGVGRVRLAHGDLPVPVPAVLEFRGGLARVRGRRGRARDAHRRGAARGDGDELGRHAADAHHVDRIGAGHRDLDELPNLLRVVLGEPVVAREAPSSDAPIVLETNVDDLDPRLWPGILARLIEAGASTRG